MSRWTHVIGVFHIETDIESIRIKSMVNKELEKAPKITGSEGNAEIFINLPEPDLTISFPTGRKEYCTRPVITVIGDLRDRYKEETEKEVEDFVKWLKENYTIRQCSYKVIEF